MGVLRRGRALGLPGALVGTDIALAVGPGDILLGGGDGLIGDAEAVGTHIGDQTHGAMPAMSTPSYRVWAARMVRVAVKAQAAGGLLLQGTGDERRGGLL